MKTRRFDRFMTGAFQKCAPAEAEAVSRLILRLVAEPAARRTVRDMLGLDAEAVAA